MTPFVLCFRKGKRVDATVKMLTSEEVERMLRENESTHAVSRPGNPVYRELSLDVRRQCAALEPQSDVCRIRYERPRI